MKNYLNVILAIIIITIVTGSAFFICPYNSKTILTAPKTVEIGELIILDASQSEAASFEWKVIPETPNFIIIESGERAFFSSSIVGKYLFIVATANGNKVDCIIHEIEVVKEKKKDVFVEMIKSWLPEKNNPVLLSALARSFEESTNAKDLETLLNTTAIANRVVLGNNLELYKPFLAQLSEYLQKNYQDATLQKHLELWFKIAETLKTC